MTRRQTEKLNQPFSITSVCRTDLVEALHISKKETLAIGDSDMQKIADKLADAYCDNGFWIDLPIIAEHVLDIE